jgi:transcription initiation factor TFIIIB Brf1 subunit/transcription initiation factor TFIIB
MSEKHVRTSEGSLVCADCGYVFGYEVDNAHEIRTFSPDEYYNKMDHGPAVHAGSFIMQRTEMKADHPMRRLRMRLLSLHRWRLPSERRLEAVFSYSRTYVSRLGLPGFIVDETMYVFKKILRMNASIIRGWSSEHIALAIIYATCRNAGIPLQFRDIEVSCRKSVNDMKLITKFYRMLIINRLMKINKPSSEIFVDAFARKLDVDTSTTIIAKDILRELKSNPKFAGKKPSLLAASALYIAASSSPHRLTQKQIADVANVSQAGIRHIVSEILKEFPHYQPFCRKKHSHKQPITFKIPI